ncbi:DUF6701 domain-containing protein [Vibrio litoralis]|uniref:DUF6701 domain-containing protein n=1 Tax=Vibrio litoralis TaxID=335972 RepID=UPI000422DF2B|nr:DUF6701 domain-containing protein [Vibrio litoralis]
MKPFFASAIAVKNIVLKKLNCLFSPLSMMLCILALGATSQSAWAEDSCSVKGNKNFDITVIIEDYDPAQSYDINYEKNGTTLVWSNHDDSAVIYDTTLEEGQKYQLKFYYDTAASTVTYYKNKNDSDYWSEGVTENADFHNGDSVFIQGGADDIQCLNSGDVEPPESIPDVCELVPDVLQSNYYTGGSVYGNLSTTPGAGNKIYLPSDDTNMSFHSTFSTDCYYPEAGGPVDCKVDPSKLTPGYPFVLEDHFTGETLTIAAGETSTLEAGEYWFDTITFGGDKSSLVVNGMAVIHYKQLVVPPTGSNTRIYINDGGAPRDLLFIGHGPDAAVLTDENSAAITSYAHYYVANEADQGLTLGGSNSIFYGGLAANAVSLSGVDNVFNGEGSCGDPDPEPPTPEPDPDVCTFFPSGLQGNVYDEQGKISVPIVIKDGNGGGGNRIYLDEDGVLGFSAADNSIYPSDVGTPSSGCVYRNADGSFPASNETHSAVECNIDPNLDAFDGAPPMLDAFAPSGDAIQGIDNGTVTANPGNYSTINFANNASVVVLTTGTYWIDTLDFSKNGAILQTAGDGQVIIHYNHITFGGDRVFVNADTNRSNEASQTPDTIETIRGEYSPQNLMLLGHGPESGLNNPHSDTYINALWYISPESTKGVDISSTQRFQFSGALSAPQVSITGGSDYSYVYSIPGVACPEPDPDASYTIEVTPDEGYYLSCDAPNITFTVKDDSGEIATDYDGNINATFPNGLVPDNDNIIQGKVIDADNNVYQPVDGQVIVPVTSGEYKSYEVEGELADDSSQTDTGNIDFVPFAFYVDDQHVIAGKSQSVEVKALACDSDTNDKVAVNYSGTPDVTSSLKEPSGGVGTLDFDASFTGEDNGEVSTDLTFTDSGKVSVTLEDKSFDCTGYEGCPIGEDGKMDGVMKGGFTVYSRPWTFAICDADNSAMDGNITDSASLGYKAAGQEFDLHIRPLRWVSGVTDPVAGAENIDVTELCDKPITQNYLSSASPDSTIQLSYELAQPSPDVGHEGSLSGTQSLVNTESSESGENGYYDFAQLAWSEVGVLTVKIDTPEDEKYYGMNINQGYRNIGRFYPDHLSILQNSWEYAGGHNGFAYMNQPIGMTYTVEARNVSDSPTQNYGYFTESLQAQVEVVGVDEDNQSLASRFYVGDEGTDVGWSSVTPISDRNAQYVYSTGNFEFYKLTEEDAPYASTPDGPFDVDNSNWGMEVTDSTVDQVNFDFNDNDNSFTVDTLNEKAMAFSEKPNFRYGRMVLDSVSSPIGGPVSVPLRAEYWDGESYVVNEDDSGSQFEASVYCAIDEDTAAANDTDYLTDTDGGTSTDQVEEGTSSIVQAGQEEGERATVRIFLRQGSDGSENFNNPLPEETCEWHKEDSIGQPWLQFNWRNKGDEDPSTVVSFGAYRGNDRIIFRGEDQLTAN